MRRWYRRICYRASLVSGCASRHNRFSSTPRRLGCRGASDAPVESTNVLHAIECCVTREGFEPQQGLTAFEALRLFTRDAAYIQFEENEKGTLAAGKRADLAVLSANPLNVRPDGIAAIEVLRTVVGGEVTFSAGTWS